VTWSGSLWQAGGMVVPMTAKGAIGADVKFGFPAVFRVEAFIKMPDLFVETLGLQLINIKGKFFKSRPSLLMRIDTSHRTCRSEISASKLSSIKKKCMSIRS
jgi:hypothetical protein